jgi:hypothetical protein
MIDVILIPFPNRSTPVLVLLLPFLPKSERVTCYPCCN